MTPAAARITTSEIPEIGTVVCGPAAIPDAGTPSGTADSSNAAEMGEDPRRPNMLAACAGD